MKRTAQVLLVLLAFMAIGPPLAEAQNQGTSFSVTLTMNDKTDLDRSLGSFIRRELRTLGDVVIVDEKPDYEIQLVAIQVLTERGKKAGIAVSMIVLSPLGETMNTLASFCPDTNAAEGEKELWKGSKMKIGLISSQHHNVVMFAMMSNGHQVEAVRETATDLITRFDTQVLEPIREMLRKYDSPQ